MKTRLALFAVAFACLFLGDSRHADAQQFYPYGGVAGGITGSAVTGTGFWHSTAGTLDAASSEPSRLLTGTTNATLGSGTYTLTLGGVTAAQMGLASTDFIAMGGATVASAGLMRAPVHIGTWLASRDNVSGDDVQIAFPDTAGSIAIGNGTGTSSMASTWTTNGSIQLQGPVTSVGQATLNLSYQSGLTILQNATGTAANPSVQFTNNVAGSYALGFFGTYNGTYTELFGASVTSANIGQAQVIVPGVAVGQPLTITAQQGRAQNSTNNNNNGGPLNISSGIPGTGGSGTAGNPGALNLQVGAVTVDSAQCGVPLAGIGHAGGVNALCTVAQATSATTTRYRVQYLCKATTLYTGGAATDTWATAVSYVVRNVGGTLTAVSVTTADTELITDSSVSTNSATMSLSGTNVTFNVTPPTVAAGVETCSAVARVAQTL